MWRPGKEKSGHLFGWEKQKADLMSICSGRRKQQVLLTGAGPSAEIGVKREVEESSRMCAHNVCLCVRASGTQKA